MGPKVLQFSSVKLSFSSCTYSRLICILLVLFSLLIQWFSVWQIELKWSELMASQSFSRHNKTATTTTPTTTTTKRNNNRVSTSLLCEFWNSLRSQRLLCFVWNSTTKLQNYKTTKGEQSILVSSKFLFLSISCRAPTNKEPLSIWTLILKATKSYQTKLELSEKCKW